MGSLLIIVLVLSGVAIIGLVLIQHGKGADMGASFGSGASQTVFGSAGTGNALTRATTWLALVFFIACLGLAWMARNQANSGTQVDSLLVDPTAAKTAAPADKPKDAVQPAAGDIPAAQAQSQSEVPAAPAAAAPAASESAPQSAPQKVEQNKQTPQN